MTDQTHCRELLSSYLTTQGFFTEAENVINGVDLESYENELSLVAFVLMAHAQASAPEGEAVAYYCTKLRDRYGDNDKITGEKWLEEKATMDRNEAHMLEHDFGWTTQALYTRSNDKAGEDARLLAMANELAQVQSFDPWSAKTISDAQMLLRSLALSTQRGDGSEMGVES